MSDELLSMLACPVCLDGELLGLAESSPDTTVICSLCDAKYPVRDGVPILLPPDCDPSSVHDELHHAHDHKHRQAGYFDHAVAEDFETRRPHGTPRAYRWLLARKLNRAIAHLPDLRRATVVDACCGSGMEAEFLVRKGARVVAIDISEGAAHRARARARRYNLDYLVVVGDVERLPVRTGAADVAFVHDGLHHLADPLVGVQELARVSRQAVSITEPADAALTQVAVKLGLATNEEEAGNEVRRLRPERVRQELAATGFSTQSERYLMYYGHEPGLAMRLLSVPALFTAFRIGLDTVDLLAGGWGNKLCVAGVRTGQGTRKLSPSAADISILRKGRANLRLLRTHAQGRKASPDFSTMFQQFEEYDAILTEQTGRHLRDACVFEIGYGARPWRLIALTSMDVDASGVDIEVPFLAGSPQEFLAAFRHNGLERALKSLVRSVLVDRRERSALADDLRRRGHPFRVERPRFLVSDAAALEFPDNQFDLIFSEDVFEHVNRASLEALVPRMARWLKPDGLALIRPNIFTGILGGHLAEWGYPSVLDPTQRRKSGPWEHLRARRFPPNTFLNELRRSEYRELFSREFEVVKEVVLLPGLGREYLTGEVACDLGGYPEEELFSNKVLFVLRPIKA